MIYFTENQIENLLKEDVPYIDLTTELLGIGNEFGKIEYTVREDAIVSCTEEVKRIFSKLDIECTNIIESGNKVSAGQLIIAGEGKVSRLHMAWKICLNILEYSLGVSTSAYQLSQKARLGNPDISVFFTRKSFPGTKQFVVKAAMAGGVFPHRLGVSETVLVFENHLRFVNGYEGLVEKLSEMKKKACEKKIIVEVEKLEDAEKLARAGVNGIQFDKVPPKELAEYVERIRRINKDITLIAAGGVKMNNIQEYSSTGVDAIATSCIFHGKPIDISAKIWPV